MAGTLTAKSESAHRTSRVRASRHTLGTDPESRTLTLDAAVAMVLERARKARDMERQQLLTDRALLAELRDVRCHIVTLIVKINHIRGRTHHL